MPYLRPLMERLLVLLQAGDSQMQEIATGCIAALAAAAADKFDPYFDTTIAYMRVRLLPLSLLNLLSRVGLDL